MTNEQKINRIIEWLFINGKDWQCPVEFREKFVAELREVLEDSQYVHSLYGGNVTNLNYPDNNFTSPCSCGTSVKCPIHNCV